MITKTSNKRYRIIRIEHTTIDVVSDVNPANIKWDLCDIYATEFKDASYDSLVDWDIEELDVVCECCIRL